MAVVDRISSLVHGAANSWPLIDLRRRSFDRDFEAGRAGGAFRGVFSSYEACQASAPPERPTGYDLEDAALMYTERTRQVYPGDYPMLFWIGRLFAEGARRVFDVGGHIGVGYYAYQRYLEFPPDVAWRVCDVPAVVGQGRKWAASHDASRRLSFTTDIAEAAGADILMASGSLQYVPYEFHEKLAALESRPRALLLNLLPVHPTREYFTLQSIVVSFCAYRIFSREKLLANLGALGYVLRDSWENAEKRCGIAFEPALSLDRYYGFYLELKS